LNPGTSIYRVDAPACIRCGACATVAPRHFSVKVGTAKVVRNPETPEEKLACDAAAVLCPTEAIVEGPAELAPDAPTPRPATDLYPQLGEIAEGVRWRQSDLPWNKFNAAEATPQLRAVVKAMAFSEQTTFSATQRFMEAFGSDADFSQWISVWFFEETRHPMSLLRWLELAGETVDSAFVAEGRQSTPFMKSLVGTLAINVISEMTASHAYLQMVAFKKEPLIANISQRIAGDEARHGASFFAYARRAIAASANPDRERLEVLKVMHFWLAASKNVSHPVNQAMQRVQELLPALGHPGFGPPQERIARAVGLLTGLPIHSPVDLAPQLLEHTKRVSAMETTS
jgi:ferredoxin/rubrerythrin